MIVGCHNFEKLAGQKFGRLTVLDDDPDIDENRCHIYLCECECGNIKYIRKDSLKRGITKSCGCLVKDIASELGKKMGGNRYIDLINQKYGRLLVISYVDTDQYERCRWLCKCDCGKEKVVPSNYLRTGKTKSCGCLNSELLIQRHKTYRISKGLNPDEPIDQRDRKEFQNSGIIEEILKRDHYTCQCCYLVKNQLQVHHILHWSTHIELRYEKKNLITLCKKCHRDIIHNGDTLLPADEKTIKFLINKIERIYQLQEIH